MTPDQLKTFYTTVNLIIFVGLSSIALAILWGIYRDIVRHRWLSTIFAAFFAGASAGRFMRAFNPPSPPGSCELGIDFGTALFAAIAGVLIWPILRSSLQLPNYRDLEVANQQLERYKQLFESFMESSPAITFLKDADSRLVYVNRTFERTFGVNRENVLGKADCLQQNEEHLQQTRINDELVLKTGKPITAVEHAPLRPGGETEPWLVSKFLVPNLGSTGPAVGGIAISLSERTKLDKVQAELTAIVESSQNAIVGKDLNGNITSWNCGAEELYGYTAEEVIGRPISLLVPPDRSGEDQRILELIKKGERLTDYETIRLCKDGTLKNVSLSVSPIRNGAGRVVGAAVNARDVTVLKRTQQELKDLNEVLQMRVYELAEQSGALQAARDQALEASNLKSAFCANISHELRTPLSGILGLNELLLSTRLDGNQKQLVGMVHESAKALLNVVNDVLDLSKIESGKVVLEYAPFNPIFLLQDCSRLMSPTAHSKGIEYRLEIDKILPTILYGDGPRLRQVLLNLIGNAIKFTERGSVRIRAEVVDSTEAVVTVKVSVTDTGIGIAADDLRFLFTPFQQIDNSSTRRFGGTGLGLSISKRFVEMMKGEIGVKSSDGQGSTFWISIPFDRKNQNLDSGSGTKPITKPGIEPLPAELALGKRILVVEDSPVLQQLALRQLASLGVQADETISGREAIELALSDRYDVILMDVNLPDITGMEATSAIRDLERSAGRQPIPIIAMTAGAMKGDRERCLDSGMDDYLAKPVSIEQLKQKLELWLKHARMRQRSSPPVARPIGTELPPPM